MFRKLGLYALLLVTVLGPASALAEKPSLFNRLRGVTSQDKIQPFDLNNRKRKPVATGPTFEERRVLQENAQMQRLAAGMQQLTNLAQAKVQASLQQSAALKAQAGKNVIQKQSATKPEDNRIMVYQPERQKNRGNNRPSLYNQP